MSTLNLTSLLQKTVIVTMIVALSPTDAQAWRFGSFGSFGGWGSWGSCGSHGGYYHSYGSGGSYGSYGSHGGYGPIYYSTPIESAPESAPEAPPETAPPAPANETQTNATIRLTVPADAKVFVNNRSTESTGPERHYVALGLRANNAYAYRLRVEYQRNGQQVVENKWVPVKAGDTIELEFGAAEQLAEQKDVNTQLTLHVPQDAKVLLHGIATTQTGKLRNFATSALAAGKTWDNYVVRVEAERDGQKLSEEKKLTLVGGKSHELTFDFADEPNRLAALE
jgi:uncharacterized protein (TIGR03000 family)